MRVGHVGPVNVAMLGVGGGVRSNWRTQDFQGRLRHDVS